MAAPAFQSPQRHLNGQAITRERRRYAGAVIRYVVIFAAVAAIGVTIGHAGLTGAIGLDVTLEQARAMKAM